MEEREDSGRVPPAAIHGDERCTVVPQREPAARLRAKREDEHEDARLLQGFAPALKRLRLILPGSSETSVEAARKACSRVRRGCLHGSTNLKLRHQRRRFAKLSRKP